MIEAQEQYYLFLNIGGEERTKLLTIIIWIVGNLQRKLLQQVCRLSPLHLIAADRL
jgi:hypothetical protein